MAYIVSRLRKAGPRFTVYSTDPTTGRKFSIGTWPTWEQAESARLRTEDDALLASTGPPTLEAAQGAVQTLRDYIYDTSPHGYRARATIEPSTWLGYEVILRRHVLPLFGNMAVRDIRRTHVRTMINRLHSAGVGAATIERARKVVSAVMSTLIDHDVIETNPAYLVKTPPVRRREKPILTPDEVAALIRALPTEGARLYALMLIETGCRQGEASELRKSDVDWRDGTIEISRAVADVGDEANPEKNGRFLVKTPKGKQKRFVTISSVYSSV